MVDIYVQKILFLFICWQLKFKKNSEKIRKFNFDNLKFDRFQEK